MIQFRDLPDFMLAPLAGQPDDAWTCAPAGRWSPGEIVDHIATAIQNSATGFASRTDKPPMTRRPRTMIQRVASFVIFRIGAFPPGRKAPASALPQAKPDRAATEAKLRNGVKSFLELERTLAAREKDLFVKHPVLGDLTLREFMLFHVRHGAHHRRQMIERIGGHTP